MNIDNKKLKQFREKAGFTQKEMAKRIGVSDISYQYYELGIRNPKSKTVKRIELVLNTNICYENGKSTEELIKNIVCNMKEAKMLLCIDEIGELKVNDVVKLLEEIK